MSANVQERTRALSAQDGQPQAPDYFSSWNYRAQVYMMWIVALTSVMGFSAFIYFFGLLIFDLYGYGTLQYGFISMGVSIFGVINQMG
jgi:fatty acid desaturase